MGGFFLKKYNKCHGFFLQVSKAACILTTQNLMRILRSKEAAASVNIKTWPTIIDTGNFFVAEELASTHYI